MPIPFVTEGKIRILHLEDLPSDAELVERTLRKGKIAFEKLVVDNKISFEKALKEFLPDIILSDHTLPGFDSEQAFIIVKESGLNTPFILITGTMSEEFAVAVMKQGVYDYILKDHLERLPNAVLNAIEKNRIALQCEKAEEKLISSEVQYRRLFEAAQDGILILNADTGVIENVNPFLEKRLGYSHAEFLGKQLWEIGFYKDIQENKSDFLKLKKDGYIRYENLPLKTKDGQSLWVEFVSNVYDVNGKQVIQCNVRDITERKKQEENLQKNIKKLSDYKFALDESSIVTITDQNGIIKHANKNFCEISKYSEEELIGQNHRIVNSGFHPKELFSDLWTTVSSGKVWRNEVKSKAKDGTYFWADTAIVPFLDKKRKPFQYIAIRKNITKRKMSEELLLESETNLRAIFDNTDTGFVLLDTHLSIISFNDRGNEIAKIACGKEFHKGLNYIDLIPSTNQESFVDNNNKVLQGNSISYEAPYPQSDGSVVWFEINNKPVKNKQDAIIGISFAITDITERKKAEKIHEKMTADIMKRNEDLEQFSYMVSHNLRGPVANILGITSLSLDENPDLAVEKELIVGLSVSAKKLDNVVMDLNTILNIRNKGYLKGMVIFSQLTSDIESSIKNLIEKEKATITFNFSEVDEMLTIKSYLHSIFYNLISNSIKYHQPNIPTLIEITSHKLNNKIILLFKDNGIGIDLNKFGNQVFGFYKRFHPNIAEGNGIGLHMVKTQVESLGGTISIESEVDKGTTFKIEFET